ncbi:short-chain dehydrogenase [Mycobacteriaceae bacterium 1482268.1]|nr:short-chain dehydrogenase [Mycobacteriaceae bacterium 1482268.1]
MPVTRTVFITGAAAGIGRATALTFARRGYTVGGYDIDDAGLASLTDEIAEFGGRAVTGHLDVTDSDEMARRLGDFAEQTGGRLNVMINNAGILRTGRFEDIDLSAQLKEVDINVKGVVNGMYAAFPYLRATPRPVVVNLASASAIYGQAELATYSATKFFVRGLTEALDIEWDRYDIRVISMWPVYVQTAMTATIKTGTTESLGIRLTPQDVADAILAAVEPSTWHRLVHQVHFPVGPQVKAAAVTSRLLPAWSQRLLNKRLAGM